MKRNTFGFLVITAVVLFLLGLSVLAAPVGKIAEKMAPRDATGDLEKVQGEEPPPAPESITEVQLLTLPRGKTVLKECEEPAKPLNLLENPQVRRLLKPSPDFIYNPRDLKDPSTRWSMYPARSALRLDRLSFFEDVHTENPRALPCPDAFRCRLMNTSAFISAAHAHRA